MYKILTLGVLIPTVPGVDPRGSAGIVSRLSDTTFGQWFISYGSTTFVPLIKMDKESLLTSMDWGIGGFLVLLPLFLHSHKQSLQDAWLRGNLLVLSSALQTWFPGCVGSQQLPSNMWWDSPLLSSQLCNTLPWNYCLAGFNQEPAMNFLRNGWPWDWLVFSFIFVFPPRNGMIAKWLSLCGSSTRKTWLLQSMQKDWSSAPVFVRGKLADVIVNVAKVEWPGAWPELSSALFGEQTLSSTLLLVGEFIFAILHSICDDINKYQRIKYQIWFKSMIVPIAYLLLIVSCCIIYDTMINID